MRQTKGFTLVELLVVVAIIAVLASLLLPSLGRARELARQSTCMANLKSTSSAIETYKADNKSRTPRLDKFGDPEVAMDGTTADELFTDNAGTLETAIGHAAMQNVWLLIAKDLIPEDAFTCPSDPDHEERKETGPDTKYGWTSWTQLGYSMHFPYEAEVEGGEENPASWTDHINGSVAILGDKHPSSAETVATIEGVYAGDDQEGTNQVKPSNHEKDGQAYLLCNGSAGFYKELDSSKGNRPKDSRCGKDGDDIYTAKNASGGVPGQSADEDGNVINGELDTYLVPNQGHAPQ